jgi:hypothetical protein
MRTYLIVFAIIGACVSAGAIAARKSGEAHVHSQISRLQAAEDAILNGPLQPAPTATVVK